MPVCYYISFVCNKICFFFPESNCSFEFLLLTHSFTLFSSTFISFFTSVTSLRLLLILLLLLLLRYSYTQISTYLYIMSLLEISSFLIFSTSSLCFTFNSCSIAKNYTGSENALFSGIFIIFREHSFIAHITVNNALKISLHTAILVFNMSKTAGQRVFLFLSS